MPVTIDLTDQELAELRELTRQPHDSAAVRSAMIEYMRLVRRQQLKALSGQVEMTDNWRQLEETEMRDHGSSGPRTD